MSVTAASYGYDVEADTREQCRVTLEVVLRTREHTRLFSRVDALGGATEIDPVAQAHLDECDRVSVAHDEIDLTVPTAIISREQPETVSEEMATGELFGVRPELCRAGA